MAAGGLVLAITGGYTLHLIPGKVLLVVSGIGYVISVLLFAIMPNDADYWAYVFPAMLCATLGVDVTYTVSNVFITTSLPKHRQGLAGAMINSVLFLGISFFLGFADLIVANTSTMGLRGSFKVAFWFSVGCAGFALLLLVLFVEIGIAKSDLTIEEKAELEAEASGGMINAQTPFTTEA
jgi:MFS family permease